MRSVRAVAFGVAVLALAPAVASAKTVTYYDPVTHKHVTYQTEDLRGGTRSLTPSQRASLPKAPVQYAKPDPKFDRQVVSYDTTEAPGTIVIDTEQKFLYFVMEGGKAMRMGVGVGREGFGWQGTVHVGAKREEPKWFPPPEMIQRQPELKKYAVNGMPGGDGNPLGVRALYLFDDKGKDTLYRIHGTIEPWSIGHNVSSGCIRMLNENVTVLYEMAPVGTKVVVL